MPPLGRLMDQAPVFLRFGVRAVHKSSYPMACKTGVSGFCAAGQGGWDWPRPVRVSALK